MGHIKNIDIFFNSEEQKDMCKNIVICKNLKNILSKIPEKLWQELREKSRNSEWYKFDWYNLEHYKKQEINDGFVKQENKRGEMEVPYERELFSYDCCESKRFSLGKEHPVAYFGLSPETCFAETIKEFRENKNLEWKDIDLYLKGGKTPNKDKYGYMISFGIQKDTLLLDLSEESQDLIKFIEREACGTEKTFFKSIILSRPKEKEEKDITYRCTQLIAKKALKKDFHGIVYKSVRDFKDTVNVQGTNLVLFDKTKLTSPPSNCFNSNSSC